MLKTLAILLMSLGALSLAAAEGPVPFGLDLDLAYEYRWAPSGEVLVETSATKSGIDIQRDFLDREPFGRLALGAGADQGLAVALETSFRYQWAGDWYKADNLPIVGQKGDPFLAENFFITRGVAYWRSPGLDFAFGRDKVDYGGILYGSLLPSTRLPYLDSLRAQGRLGNFTVDWMVATIQAIKSWDGVDVNPNEGADTTNGDLYGWEGGENPSILVEGLNRFSWKIDNLSLALSDHAMMVRRNNAFYLTDFFPILSRHQTAILQTNNSMVFDLAWRPLPELRVAAQLGLDDIGAQMFGINDTGAPTIWAWVAGARYGRDLAGGRLDLDGETGMTHYLWGNYDGTDINPRDVNPLMRFQYRFLSDSGAILLPLTSPYGPGAFWVRARAFWDLGGMVPRVGLSFLYLAKNEEANLITTPLDSSAANGKVLHFCELALPVDLRAGPWEIELSPALVVREGAWSFEATFLAAYRLRTGERQAVEPQAWAAPRND